LDVMYNVASTRQLCWSPSVSCEADPFYGWNMDADVDNGCGGQAMHQESPPSSSPTPLHSQDSASNIHHSKYSASPHAQSWPQRAAA